MAPRLIGRNAASRRRLRAWIARAASSLPGARLALDQHGDLARFEVAQRLHDRSHRRALEQQSLVALEPVDLRRLGRRMRQRRPALAVLELERPHAPAERRRIERERGDGLQRRGIDELRQDHQAVEARGRGAALRAGEENSHRARARLTRPGEQRPPVARADPLVGDDEIGVDLRDDACPRRRRSRRPTSAISAGPALLRRCAAPSDRGTKVRSSDADPPPPSGQTPPRSLP
jgi:hypothetical protein